MADVNPLACRLYLAEVERLARPRRARRRLRRALPRLLLSVRRALSL